jgi:hypothetical protein
LRRKQVCHEIERGLAARRDHRAGTGKRHELLPLPANAGEAVWARLSESRVLDADLGALTMRPWPRLPR